MKQMPKRAPKRRSKATKGPSKKRKVAAKRNPQVVEAMLEPNYGDMEQQTTVPTQAVPKGPASSENLQASSQHNFSNPTLARLQ